MTEPANAEAKLQYYFDELTKTSGGHVIFYGDLDLGDSDIKALPDFLTVIGPNPLEINIEGTSIDPTKLPVGVAAIQMPNAANPCKYDIIKNPRYIDPTHSTKTCKSGPARRSHTFR